MSDVVGQHRGLLSPWVDGMRMRKVSRFIPANSRVLDLGCGPAFLVRLLPSGCSYVGVDNDLAVVLANKKNYPDHFFRDVDAASVVLPFNDDSFDVVVLAAVLEHMKNPRILLSEASRVLKSSGLVVATTPSSMGGHLHGMLAAIGLLSHEAAEDHETFWNRESVEAMLSGTGLRLAGFKFFQMGLNQLFLFKKEFGRE